LVGQGSILVFIALFIRYVVFEDGATAIERRRKERKKVHAPIPLLSLSKREKKEDNERERSS